MLRCAVLYIALVVFGSPAFAVVDCRIRTLPPAHYASKALPPVRYKGLPLARLQTLYREFAGLPRRAAGVSYCADPIGFVYPWNRGHIPTIYFPTDVSERCLSEVLAHEEAHVKGWPLDHPNGRHQRGTCQRGR